MMQKIKYQWITGWRDWLVVGTAVLVLASLVLVGFGIDQNNKLAAQNKDLAAKAQDHLDCVIKDLTTPLPPGAKAKYIDIRSNLTADCNIKFTK